MIKWGRALGAASLAALLGAMAAGQAFATPTSVDVSHTQVQVMDKEFIVALNALGCSATPAEYIAALQGAISKSGQSPVVVRAALRALVVWPKLCGTQSEAIANVDRTVALAMSGQSVPAAQALLGQGGAGGPPSFVSGGGTDYTTP
ncbi:MAG TPA: hypothetical protein VMU93_11525 [Caulobacteraceae bacterium]|nr:hypothetical protein [Caulobacteraceae bacterium]